MLNPTVTKALETLREMRTNSAKEDEHASGTPKASPRGSGFIRI
jgi:hypothetical protein